MKWTSLTMAIVVGCTLGVAHANVELLTNGDFETGTFAGWTVSDLAGGSGTFSIDAPGTTTPISTIPTSAVSSVPLGNFYAVSDQTGPGTHVLTQSFTVPNNAVSVALSFSMFVNDSDAGPIVDPVGLNHTGPANQHARVDILTAAAGAFSTAVADVIGNFYIGVDPQISNPNPFTAYNFDVTALLTPGQTYQIRFGEVDNQLFLNQGVDNVSVFATTSQVIPTPAAALPGLALMGLLGLTRRRAA